MKDWLKQYVLPYVPLATFGLLLLGFYSGIRADLREISGRIDAVNETLSERIDEVNETLSGRIDEVNETLSDVRERLAVIETQIRIERPSPVEEDATLKPADEPSRKVPGHCRWLQVFTRLNLFAQGLPLQCNQMPSCALPSLF